MTTTHTNDEELDTQDDGDEEPEAPKPPKRSRRNGVAAPAAVGVAPSTPAKFQRTGTDADAVWNEIVQWLPSAGLTPSDVAIQARRVWPPSPSGESTPVGRAFGGEMVTGGQTEPPGSALNQFIIRYVHLATTANPASYDIHFMRKANGAQLAVGRLGLPDRNTCLAELAASERAGLGAQPQGGVMPPMYSPPQPPQPQWQPPPPPPLGMGYGYPPSPMGLPPGYGAPAMDPAVMNELASLRGALNEALSAAREGRQPNIPHAPPVAPVVSPAAAPVGAGGLTDLDVDRIAARVAGIMGVLPKPAAPPAAPVGAAAPVDNSLEGMMRTGVNGMMKRIFDTALGSVEQSIKRGVGIGALPQEDDNEAPAPAEVVPAAPEKPEDIMPWQVGDVGSTWGNGSPVKVALSKETGKLDPMGLAFANPIVAEKLIDVLTGLGNAAQDAIKNFGKTAAVGVGRPPSSPPTEVVRQIPAGAIDATPFVPALSPSDDPNPNGGWQAP
jgi:hypothetical protein